MAYAIPLELEIYHDSVVMRVEPKDGRLIIEQAEFLNQLIGYFSKFHDPRRHHLSLGGVTSSNAWISTYDKFIQGFGSVKLSNHV